MVTLFARPSYQSASDSHNDSEQTPSRNALEIKRLTASLETPIAVQPMPLDRYLTTKQAAVIVGRTPGKLAKWRQCNGKGPKFFRYPDGAIRYSLNELMKFLQDCTVEP
jgi:hypothetical protein